MTIDTELAAIEADDSMTPEEKRLARYAAKSAAFQAALANVVGKSYRFDGIDWTIAKADAATSNGVPVLKFAVQAERVSTGEIVWPVTEEVVVVNPPIRACIGTDPEGQPVYGVNLLQAGKEILRSLIR